MKDAWKDVGVGNVVATLDVHDHATKYKAALPVTAYEAEEVVTTIREFMGTQKAQAAYMDNHPPLSKACK
eukprot:2930886-Lingulodinium_polyedra.AAC.1